MDPIAYQPTTGQKNLIFKVYVGRIQPRTPSELLTNLLKSCGHLISFRRIQNPATGKLQRFGYAQFKDAPTVLRVLRLLNGIVIDNSSLLVPFFINFRYY